ncbi:MAG: outer membrane beta-barrel protein [Edaphobacter sp.]
MFGFRLSVKCVAGVLLAASIASGATAVQGQTTHRTRRESSANRKARIARTIAETYSHRYEVAGGGGYLRFQSGAPQRNNEVTFFMSGTYFLNPKLGIIGEIRGAYGNAKIGNTACTVVGCIPVNLGFNPQISEYPFLGGVAYRLYAKEKIAITATGEGGAAIGKFDDGAKGLPSAVLGVWESTTKPAFSIGANIDYNFYPNLAFRVSPTYVGTFFRRDPTDVNHGPNGTIQNNVGVNLGIVYRFGKIK